MRSYFTLVFLILLTLDSACQSDSSFVPIAAYWEKGDTLNFNITRIKKTWTGRTLTQNDSTRYTARFLVIDADTSSYTIEWSLHNTLFEALRLPEESIQKYPSFRNTVVVYKTDEFGSFLGILNWQEISRMINDLINEAILVNSKDSNVNTEDIRKLYQPLITAYSSQKGIEQLIFKELLMLHYPFGKQYKKGEIYNYTEEIPVMRNSEPATANGIVFIRFSNDEKKRCELVQRLKILPDSAKKFLRNYFHSIGMRPEAIGSTIESSTVEVNDENIYDLYYYPGIPVRISVSRDTKINVLEDKIKQTDRTVIELIEH